METEYENKHFVGQLKLDHGMEFMEDGTEGDNLEIAHSFSLGSFLQCLQVATLLS
jgi:hypothetical protein